MFIDNYYMCMKILLRAFNINIEDVEDKLRTWKAKFMLKQNVTSDLAPFQMFRFYHDFDIKDTSFLRCLFHQPSTI